MSDDFDCTCISGEEADGLTETISQEMRTARKQHKCLECREPILPGQRYESYVGTFDGDFLKYKTCAACVEIRGHFSSGGWMWGSVWEDLGECFFPNMTAGGPCLEGLSAAAKTKLFEMWRKWKGLAA